MKKFVLIVLFVFGFAVSTDAMVKGGDNYDYSQEPAQEQVPLNMEEDFVDEIVVEEDVEKTEGGEDSNLAIWIGLISTLVVGCVTPITIALINRRKRNKE